MSDPISIIRRLLPYAQLALGSVDFPNDAPGQFEPCAEAVAEAEQFLFRMDALEDEIDLKAAQEALAEEGSRPWAEVKEEIWVDLGRPEDDESSDSCGFTDKGFVCTRKTGHSGRHIAHGSDDADGNAWICHVWDADRSES